MRKYQTGGVWFGGFWAGLLLLAGGAADLSAQSIRYPNDGYDWNSRPDGRNVLDCFGNCGRGCGEFSNPCGGSSQYWELEITSPVTLVREFDEDRCETIDVGMPGDVEGEIYRRWVELYRARGRWTYHGLTADLCVWHDTRCRGISIWVIKEFWCYGPTGIWAMGRAAGSCANAAYNSWDYSASAVYGYKRGRWRATGESCTVFGQSGP